MHTTANAPRPRSSVWTDPQLRAWLFQILAVASVIAFGWYLFDNTQQNLAQRGIVSGFGFLDNNAGFGIAQHLIDYNESNSYGRVFVVGLLNTLLVSVIGILFATVLGFLLGVARLSPNWILSKLATVYIETFRNIPPLLQIFFWYFAVMLAMPGPRQSHEFAGAFFLNNRGLYLPAPAASDAFVPFLFSLLVAAAVIVGLVRWSLYAQLNAEELGVTSANVEEMAKSTKNPDIARLLGAEGDFGKDLKLPKDWAVQIVKQVGNYGEIFDRNVGAGSELKIERGLNALWNKGGMQYAPPVR